MRLTGQQQVISQIKKTQLIHVNNHYIAAHEFFKNYSGKKETIEIRHQEKEIIYCALKCKVKSLKQKVSLIALKYKGESGYRYLIATDMCWFNIDVIKTFALRWLAEVFIQDWKSYEGWNQLAKQRDMIGSVRGLTLSLLSDHVLHFYQDQLELFENNEQAATVASLRESIMMQSIIALIEKIIMSENPKQMFDRYAERISELFELKSSKKYMRNLSIQALEAN